MCLYLLPVHFRTIKFRSASVHCSRSFIHDVVEPYKQIRKAQDTNNREGRRLLGFLQNRCKFYKRWKCCIIVWKIKITTTSLPRWHDFTFFVVLYSLEYIFLSTIKYYACKNVWAWQLCITISFNNVKTSKWKSKTKSRTT